MANANHETVQKSVTLPKRCVEAIREVEPNGIDDSDRIRRLVEYGLEYKRADEVHLVRESDRSK